MGWKGIWLLFIVLVAACEPALNTTHVTGQKIEPDANSCSPDCSAGFVCEDGSCSCPEGTNECNKECITGCCSDSDCDVGVCVDQTCVERELCEIGQEWKNGECVCSDDYFLCSFQDKCIPKGNCCRHTECGSFERCVPTITRTSVCLKMDQKKVCKAFIGNDRLERFTVLEEEFLVSLEKFNEDGSMIVSVNNESFTLLPNEEIGLDSAKLFFEDLDTYGGVCKDEEFD